VGEGDDDEPVGGLENADDAARIGRWGWRGFALLAAVGAASRSTASGLGGRGLRGESGPSPRDVAAPRRPRSPVDEDAGCARPEPGRYEIVEALGSLHDAVADRLGSVEESPPRLDLDGGLDPHLRLLRARGGGGKFSKLRHGGREQSIKLARADEADDIAAALARRSPVLLAPLGLCSIEGPRGPSSRSVA
jgi:hypothetical protein